MSADPLNILVIAGRFEVRGSSTQTLNVAEHLPKFVAERLAREHPQDVKPEKKRSQEAASIRVVCFDASRLSRQQSDAIPLEVIGPLAWPIVGTLARRYLLTSVFESPPKVIHIQGQSMHGLGAWLARRLKRPYVMTLHREVTPRDSFKLDRVWGRRVIATSEAIRESVREHTRTPESLITLIRNGVVIPPPRPSFEILDRSHCPVIGTAGPLEVGQGVSHFIRAIPRILATGPAPLASADNDTDLPEFLIAGSGPDEHSLRSLARELGVASRTTFVSNLYDFAESLSAMDLFCLPATRSGMGITMLEAMARGVPVVATNVGHAGRVIEPGTNGLLVPPGSPDALAEAVSTLLRDVPLSRRLGVAGRALVEERYPLNNMLEDMCHVYRAAIDGN